MTASLYWQVEGNGSDLVLVHGWGMNGAVWHNTVEILKQTYRVHVVDLPGYGHSAHTHAATLEEIAGLLIEQAPKNAIWVGWSLGGLVATHMALHHADYVSKLVTVASSPKFSAERGWKGIQPQVLTAFTEQLVDDFQLTIERFMALQAMGSPTARQDVKQLKKMVLSRPAPQPEALMAGLKMLADVDFRAQMAEISVPMLRLYGRLDGLVPVQIAGKLDTLAPDSTCYIFTQSSHAPFMTETEHFCQQILLFSQ
ncbi:pimeloyl-ACP methyl ester esterase BioH [Vibrio mangrovi]|uniref:Pimeloyl-[acyl-carrier protein] methyl ester esterase n=1 Tax=Vibrio mangrovi TaxID=474394 RepID=A0A1Y6IYT1_9VIBR|nr:pimeloyl-ACP methyl ester esterase BioH [Vibrio mangrovi]MDW6002648.1 pimeloyl-ACP methyl ester esterase BioH [Vibrio mangrovi]SMS02807.1 Pimeloyl-[acyl-carrier protein] methyl ester esterase [Vibrio mangrovi]